MNCRVIALVSGLALFVAVAPAGAVEGQVAYAKECSACHMAYPANFLPARSWEKLMAELDKHFGENAELSAEETQAIRVYLVAHAADKAGDKRGARVMKYVKSGDVPLRITELEYFKRLHHELKPKHSTENPEVKSMARCQACHTRAEQGSFAEREIKIPGFGRWED